MKKFLRQITATVLRRGRNTLSKEARIIMKEDPRQAYRAVRHTVYKSIVGGQLNILAKRRAGNTRAKLNRIGIIESDPGHRGGNRIKRSSNTDRIDSYFAQDRGFILRFLNNGAYDRNSRYGNRGSIQARNWFEMTSTKAMQNVVKEFEEETEKAINEIINIK